MRCLNLPPTNIILTPISNYVSCFLAPPGPPPGLIWTLIQQLGTETRVPSLASLGGGVTDAPQQVTQEFHRLRVILYNQDSFRHSLYPPRYFDNARGNQRFKARLNTVWISLSVNGLEISVKGPNFMASSAIEESR